MRSREYLTPKEVDKLLASARKLGRHGHRDRTLILVMYRHGLRVSELVRLRWDQVDLDAGLIHVNRLKNGTPAPTPGRRGDPGAAEIEAGLPGDAVCVRHRAEGADDRFCRQEADR